MCSNLLWGAGEEGGLELAQLLENSLPASQMTSGLGTAPHMQ